MKNFFKNFSFWKFYAIYIGVLAIVMAILLIIGYNAMMAYEEAQGVLQRTSAEVAEDISNGDLSWLLEDKDGLESGGVIAPAIFEREAYLAEIEELTKDGVTYRKGFSADRYNKPVYDIMAGSKKVASLEFEKLEGAGGFGFDTYKLARVVPENSGKYSVSVLLPEDAEFYINDVKVDDNWLATDNVSANASANALYSEESVSASKKYTVSGLYENAEPKVIFTSTGEEAKLVYDNDLQLWKCKDKELTILAPSNYKVFVEGVEISGVERFIAEKDIAIEGAERTFERYMKEAVTMVKYSVSGLKGVDGEIVTAKNYDGSNATVTCDEETGVYTVSMATSFDVIKSKFGVDKSYLIDRAHGYAKAVHNDGSKYSLLLDYIDPSSETYAEMEEFWVVFSKHGSYSIENTVCDAPVVYSDDLFSVRVTMDYWIKNFDGNPDATKVYNVAVTLYYAHTANGLKIVDYVLG